MLGKMENIFGIFKSFFGALSRISFVKEIKIY
jgi:hypothetical protein